MADNWFTRWWVILIGIIIILGIVSIFLQKDAPKSIKEYFENVIDSVKDIIGMEDSEPSNTVNPQSNSSMKNETQDISISADGGGGGGGGGGGSSDNPEIPDNTTTLIEDYETFSSLEELFNSENPVGNKVSVQGIALQITGVSTSDSFFFTDDENVINDITYMLFNKIEYHITVYNSIHVSIPQSIITLTGTIVDCENNDDGIYCVNAESIE